MAISTYNKRVVIYIVISILVLSVALYTKREHYINANKLQMFFAICGPPFVYRVTNFVRHLKPRLEIFDHKIESSKSVFFILIFFYFMVIIGSMFVGKFDTIYDSTFLGVLALNESILGTILSYYLVTHIAKVNLQE